MLALRLCLTNLIWLYVLLVHLIWNILIIGLIDYAVGSINRDAIIRSL